MINRILVLTIFILPIQVAAQSVLPDRKAICIPVGSKIFAKLGVKPRDEKLVLKKDLKFGLAKLPKGCIVIFGYGDETTGKETDQELEAIRYIRVLADCPQAPSLFGTKFLMPAFNSEGCLDGGQSIGEEKTVCGKPLKPGQSIYFDNGFLDCMGRKEKEESRL